MAPSNDSTFAKVPTEILLKIFDIYISDEHRIVGTHPERDLRAPRRGVPAIARINRKTRDVFLGIYVRVVDRAQHHASPDWQRAPGNRPGCVYVHPTLDTLVLGYETMLGGGLIEAPVVALLVDRLRKVWLHDKDLLASASHFGRDETALPVLAELPVDDLLYRKLESITISSEGFDVGLRGCENTFGFEIVYHVETGSVYMTEIESLEEADWVNQRLGTDDFTATDGFLARISIDRTIGIGHIEPASVDAVIKYTDDDDDDDDDEEHTDDDDDQDDDQDDYQTTDSSPLPPFEHADPSWHYIWQICVDYIILRLI